MKRWHILAAASVYFLLTGQQTTPSLALTTADRVYQSGLSYVGKTTAEAGSWVDPGVSCAAFTSIALQGAGLSIPKHAAVVTGGGLVGNLKAAGWQYVPRSQAKPGCVVYHNATPDPSEHGKEHIGLCSRKGCTTAINTKGGEVVNDNYPERYKKYIDRGQPWGGVLCPTN